MNILIIDGNSLGYYHQQQPKKLHSGDMETQAIFGFITNMRRYASLMKARPIVLWDGFSDARRSFYPEYKANRDDNSEMKKMKEGFAIQKPLIKKAITALGVDQITALDGEADDLAGILKKRYEANKDIEHIYLLTADSDWIQLVDEKVTWISLREDAKHKRITMEAFSELTGYPNQRGFLEGKALQGDKSDNIQQVGGIGEKGAMDLISEYGSMVTLVKGICDGSIVMDKGRNKTAVNNLAKNAFNEKTGCRMLEAFMRNIKLMDLIDTKFAPQKLEVIRGEQSLETFKQICMQLSFQSILGDLEVFVVPFVKRCGLVAE
ncbi:exonuclease [Klebsiella grimontii]|uniref:5'-3' exonuclease family protein n=1 Tax=Klebsiella grimontii TaxID=2058152 RepID=UPI00166D67B8|nr:5'-3' exonuclease H3TH domain-containing protein [Klebsiella grimontii]MBD0905732.1 exonuclease [Klebsiella grimontii]